MDTKMKDMLHEITQFMEHEATSKTVIGDAFKLGEFDCIPVIRVGMGFGSGKGERDLPKKEHDEGYGAGAGMGIDPIGFLVSKKGEISFIHTKTNTGLSAAFEKVPELIDKYLETRKLETAQN
jgi:uncharacterized spore protein YtfJ